MKYSQHKIKSLSIIGLFLLITGFLSCNSNANKSRSLSLDLTGQVLTYAPELDTANCEVFGYCDCCSGKFLFLNDKDFITIDYCEADNSYAHGVYEIKDRNVILHYSGTVVNKNYNWEKETDTTGTVTTEFFINQQEVEPSTTILTRLDCNKNICFNTDIKEIPFAALDSTLKLADLVKQIKDDGIWDKLEMK